MGKKIDVLIWVKGIDQEEEGSVLKDAVGLKKYTQDVVVVAGPPEKLLAPEARRNLLTDFDEEPWTEEDWASIEDEGNG